MNGNRNNRMVLIVVFILIAALASVAMMLAAVNNRPGGPEEEAAAAEEEVPAAEVAAEEAPAEAAQPERVAFTVDVNGLAVQVAPLDSEQIQLLDENIQPVVEQPAEQEPPAQEPTVAPTAVPAQSDPAATEAPPPPDPTPVPTVAPTAVPAVAGDAVACPQTAPTGIICVFYDVVAGDNLYQLTQKRNTSVELMAAFGIAADDIVIGNRLTLPVANPNHCPDNQREYVIRENDTPFSIARRFQVDLQSLLATNGLVEGEVIKFNEVLCIPAS